MNWKEVGTLLPEKAAAYAIGFGGAEDFLDAEVLRGIERDWRAQLGNVVVDLPSFGDCVAALRAVLGGVFGD